MQLMGKVSARPISRPMGPLRKTFKLNDEEGKSGNHGKITHAMAISQSHNTTVPFGPKSSSSSMDGLASTNMLKTWESL